MYWLYVNMGFVGPFADKPAVNKRWQEIINEVVVYAASLWYGTENDRKMLYPIR